MSKTKKHNLKNKEHLLSLLSQGLSTREIAKRSGVGQTTARYWIAKHGLGSVGPSQVSHGRKKGRCEICSKPVNPASTYCGMECKATVDAIEFGERWATDGPVGVVKATDLKKGQFTGTARRFLLLHKAGGCCERCGWTHDYWTQGKALPALEVHHADGNFTNNKLENLLVLCPNCHAIADRETPVSSGDGRWANGADSRQSMLAW